MRRSTHGGRRSLGSEVAPQSDQSPPHIHHSPKPLRLADHQNKIFNTRYSFVAVSHEDDSLSLADTGPNSLMGMSDAPQNVEDKALYSTNDLQCTPWECPERAPRHTVSRYSVAPHIIHVSRERFDLYFHEMAEFLDYERFKANLDSGRQEWFPAFDGMNDTSISYEAWSLPTFGEEDQKRFEAVCELIDANLNRDCPHEEEKLLEHVHQSISRWRQDRWISRRWSRRRLNVYSNAIAQRVRLDIACITGSTRKNVDTGLSTPILLDLESEHLKGRKALIAWKEGAGLSKTWRRCNRVTMSDSRIRVILRCSDQSFYNSPLWLPQAFIRSPTRQRHNDRKRTLVSVKRARRLNKHFEPLLLRFEEDKQGCEPYQSQRSLTRIQERIPADLGNAELPAAYMRLMWGNGPALDGQLDRFLPEGLILQSHWRVSFFLRNDSHADVYIVTDINHLHGPGPEFELHSFLTGLSGNSVTYAKRKQERMYKSDHCLARFWYGERRMLVVRLPKPVTPYRLQMEDFPKLKGTISRTRTQFRYAHRLSSIPTYAEVLGTTNHDPQSPPLSQQMKEEQARILEQINEKVREKKSKKQRDKRRSERLVRKLAQRVPV